MATEGLDERQVAVLIDYENVGLAAIQWLFDQVSDHGRVIVKRAYADWSQSGSGRDQRRQRDQLLELGIEPIHLFHSASGKNSSDIRLAIDAVELMYNSPVDTFVIVSSDTDFVPLVSRLRAAGKGVIGAGRKKGVSQTLVRSCDRYYYLEQASSSSKSTETTEQRPGESLLVRAVRSGMDAQGQINGGKLMETMQRMDPSFDYRGMGYSTFSRYLEASSEVSVTRPRGGGNMSVELDRGRRAARRVAQGHRPGVAGARAELGRPDGRKHRRQRRRPRPGGGQAERLQVQDAAEAAGGEPPAELAVGAGPLHHPPPVGEGSAPRTRFRVTCPACSLAGREPSSQSSLSGGRGRAANP